MIRKKRPAPPPPPPPPLFADDDDDLSYDMGRKSHPCKHNLATDTGSYGSVSSSGKRNHHHNHHHHKGSRSSSSSHQHRMSETPRISSSSSHSHLTLLSAPPQVAPRTLSRSPKAHRAPKPPLPQQPQQPQPPPQPPRHRAKKAPAPPPPTTSSSSLFHASPYVSMGSSSYSSPSPSLSPSPSSSCPDEEEDEEDREAVGCSDSGVNSDESSGSSSLLPRYGSSSRLSQDSLQAGGGDEENCNVEKETKVVEAAVTPLRKETEEDQPRPPFQFCDDDTTGSSTTRSSSSSSPSPSCGLDAVAERLSKFNVNINNNNVDDDDDEGSGGSFAGIRALEILDEELSRTELLPVAAAAAAAPIALVTSAAADPKSGKSGGGFTIRSNRGTIRGVKNRVRLGIATFLRDPYLKNYSELEKGKVVVYITTLGVLRETFARCVAVRQILRTLLIKVEERDVFMCKENQAELLERMSAMARITSSSSSSSSSSLTPSSSQQWTSAEMVPLPQVFVEGRLLGDYEVVEGLNERGELRRILKAYKCSSVTSECQRCGGFRMLPCQVCRGSKKSAHRNNFTETFVALRCSRCDDSALVRCDLCCGGGSKGDN